MAAVAVAAAAGVVAAAAASAAVAAAMTTSTSASTTMTTTTTIASGPRRLSPRGCASRSDRTTVRQNTLSTTRPNYAQCPRLRYTMCEAAQSLFSLSRKGACCWCSCICRTLSHAVLCCTVLWCVLLCAILCCVIDSQTCRSGSPTAARRALWPSGNAISRSALTPSCRSRQASSARKPAHKSAHRAYHRGIVIATAPPSKDACLAQRTLLLRAFG